MGSVSGLRGGLLHRSRTDLPSEEGVRSEKTVRPVTNTACSPSSFNLFARGATNALTCSKAPGGYVGPSVPVRFPSGQGECDPAPARVEPVLAIPMQAGPRKGRKGPGVALVMRSVS